jgi:hypothetical protein
MWLRLRSPSQHLCACSHHRTVWHCILEARLSIDRRQLSKAFGTIKSLRKRSIIRLSIRRNHISLPQRRFSLQVTIQNSGLICPASRCPCYCSANLRHSPIRSKDLQQRPQAERDNDRNTAYGEAQSRSTNHWWLRSRHQETPRSFSGSSSSDGCAMQSIPER